MAEQTQTRRVAALAIVAGICSAISAAGIVGSGALWLTGNLTTSTLTSHDLGTIRNQLELLNGLVARLQDRIESGPRPDQLNAIDAHAHALDGRMDGLETRLRLDELDIATTKQRVQSIEDNSNQRLGAARR